MGKKTLILLLTWTMTCAVVIVVILLFSNMIYSITNSVYAGALSAIGLFALWVMPKGDKNGKRGR